VTYPAAPARSARVACVFLRLQDRAQPLAELSARELEILRLLAEGRTLSQIADTVGIGYKTAAAGGLAGSLRLGA
jgi:DNA-binding NarL/FixJ family response regulator